jgi:hypothetical protein
MKGTWVGQAAFPWATVSVRLVINGSKAQSGQLVGQILYIRQNFDDCGKQLAFSSKSGSTIVVTEKANGNPIVPPCNFADAQIRLTYNQASLGFDWSDPSGPAQASSTLSR